MATSFLWYITGNPARVVLRILVFILLVRQVFPLVLSNSVRVWILIKGRKFMYIVLNFIIISILVSSSSYLTNIFLRVHKKTKINQFYSQNSVSSSPLLDDDTWSFFTCLDHEQQPLESNTTVTTPEEERTVSSLREVHEQEQPMKSTTAEESSTTSTTSTAEEASRTVLLYRGYVEEHPTESSTTSTAEEEKIVSFRRVHEEEQPLESSSRTASFRVLQEEEYLMEDHGSIVEENKAKEEDEYEIEGNSLDATWKAIMESQGKGSGPQPTKNDIWSCGEERKTEKGGLSKYRVHEKLEKWQSHRDMVERRQSGGGGSGGSGGKKRGWRSMEVALTFHDEFKKRADAFIARFTQDIRLRRLESDQRFMEMINRGI